MTTACPNGHQSEWPDWCSVCGERLGEVTPDAGAGSAPASAPTPPDGAEATGQGTAAAAAAAPDSTASAGAGPRCDNCGVARNEHDVFCESCGYDFASGSLPEAVAEADVGGTTSAAVHARVVVDPDFFAASVGDVDLALPDPLPDPTLVPLPGIRVLIGRQSTSRGVFPEIDVRALTDDPAVSSRHAMLERDGAGNWTVTDLGSTNGTFLTPDAADPIPAGTAVGLAIGATLYLGAWTRIELAAT